MIAIARVSYFFFFFLDRIMHDLNFYFTPEHTYPNIVILIILPRDINVIHIMLHVHVIEGAMMAVVFVKINNSIFFFYSYC